MHIEQVTEHQKPFHSDRLLLLCSIIGIAIACLVLAYLERVLLLRTRALQAVVFVAMIVLAYIILHRQLASFRYVLTDDAFSVYRRTGKSERLAAYIPVEQIHYVCRYKEAAGKKGQENALSTAARHNSVIVAHAAQSHLRWLLIAPNDALYTALQSCASESAKMQ